MTLARYITGRFLRMVVVVGLIFTLISGLLISVEAMRIASTHDARLDDAARMTVFQLPEVMSEAFPLVLMLGAIAAFVGLSRTSEMVIVRASGVSALKMLLMPVIAAAALGVIATTLFNPITAAASLKAEQVRADITGRDISVMSLESGNVWLRQGLETGQTVIQAARASQEGTVLYGVRLHLFDPDNQLTARIEADTAVLAGDAWVLRGVRRWPLDLPSDQPLGNPEFLSELRLPTNLTREQIQDSFAQPENIEIWALPGFIRQLEQAGFSATRHRVFLHSELARPALFVAMVLIGAGFSLRHVRFGQVGVMILMAIFAGFALYFFKDIAATLGGNGEIPVLLAAWSPPGAAIMLALALLLHLEDG